MPGNHMMRGICPICGNINTVFNPCLPEILNCKESAKHEAIKRRFPWTVFRCYHNGTPHHDDKNYHASAGSLYAMHLYFRVEGQDEYRRVYPDANDDCNKRHWKV